MIHPKKWQGPLPGKIVTLEPLEMRHAAALASTYEPGTFDWFVMQMPRTHHLETWTDWVPKQLELEDTFTYVAFDSQTRKPIGSTSFLDIQTKHDRIESRLHLVSLCLPWNQD